jgi:adenylate cyclase
VAVVDVPPTVQGVLLARLDRLSPGERRLVQEASILGLEFGEGLLRAVSSEPEAMEVHLDLLQDGELLQETARPAGALTTAERRFRFSHALVQEVAYGSLLVRRRTELHGRIGQTLEHVHGERPERLEDLEALGHHFSLSADKLRGVRYLTAAGDSARALYANEDAARCYERALDTLAMHDAVARAQQVQLWERLGDALGAVGRRADALRNYTAALEAVEQADDRPVQARLHRKMGRLRWEAGEREPALDELRAGLAVLEGRAQHIELAHLYQEMGRLAFRGGAGEQAIAWARQAVELAERIAAAADSPDARREAAAVIAHAYNTLGIAMARSGGAEAAVEQLECSLTVAREHELLQAACRAHTNLGVLYSVLDPGRAIETCLDGLDLARKIGDLGLQPWLYANLAGAYCTFTGQCEEQGIAAAHQAIELDRQLGQLDHLAVPLVVLGQIYQCHGEPARALQHYQEALSLAEQMGEPQLLFPCYDGLATLSLEAGDEAEAERYMVKAQEICERAGLDPESLVVLPFLG